MEKGLISVIIPVYKTEEYLPRCLDSILNNTYKNLEIICVNDGSPDNSLQVLNNYAAKDERIKIIDQINSGVSVARNNALDIAQGEYIAFIDSDDWVHSQYFEILLNSLQSNQADMSVCKFKICKSETDAKYNLYGNVNSVKCKIYDDKYRINGDDRVNVWRTLYKSDIVKPFRFQKNMKLCEDVLFNVEVIFKSEISAIVIVNEPLYFYFQRENSAIHSISYIDKLDSIKWYLAHIDEFPTQRDKTEVAEEAIKSLLWMRFCLKYSYSRKELKSITEPYFKECLKHLYLFSKKQQTIFKLFFKYSCLYRLYRIYIDKTILLMEWDLKHPATIEEKNKNKKIREAIYKFLSKL